MAKQVKCPIGGLYLECYDKCKHFGLHTPRPAREGWGEGDLTCDEITHTCVKHKDPIKCVPSDFYIGRVSNE